MLSARLHRYGINLEVRSCIFGHFAELVCASRSQKARPGAVFDQNPRLVVLRTHNGSARAVVAQLDVQMQHANRLPDAPAQVADRGAPTEES